MTSVVSAPVLASATGIGQDPLSSRCGDLGSCCGSTTLRGVSDPAATAGPGAGATAPRPAYSPRPAPRGPAWWPFLVALALIGSLVGALVLSNARDRPDPAAPPASSPSPTAAPSASPSTPGSG